MQSVAASPVASSSELINVATSVVASSKVREDLEQARHVGEQVMEKFIKERLLSGTISILSCPTDEAQAEYVCKSCEVYTYYRGRP